MSLLLNRGTIPDGLRIKTSGLALEFGLTRDVVEIGDHTALVSEFLGWILECLTEGKSNLNLGSKYHISQADVFSMTHYVLVNTNLYEGDPREKFVEAVSKLELTGPGKQFVECMKAMKRVPGYGLPGESDPTKLRLKSSVSPIATGPSEN